MKATNTRPSPHPTTTTSTNLRLFLTDAACHISVKTSEGWSHCYDVLREKKNKRDKKQLVIHTHKHTPLLIQ